MVYGRIGGDASNFFIKSKYSLSKLRILAYYTIFTIANLWINKFVCKQDFLLTNSHPEISRGKTKSTKASARFCAGFPTTSNPHSYEPNQYILTMYRSRMNSSFKLPTSIGILISEWFLQKLVVFLITLWVFKWHYCYSFSYLLIYFEEIKKFSNFCWLRQI